MQLLLAVMRVETAQGHIKHLPFRPQGAAPADDARHGLQLHGQLVDAGRARVRVDVGRRIRHAARAGRQHGAAQYALAGNGTLHRRHVFLLHQVVARRADDVAQGGLALGGAEQIAAADIADRYGARLAHLELAHLPPAEEQRVRRGRDGRKRGIAVARAEQVTQASAPAHAGAFRQARLPGRLLVVMRKQFRRQGHIARLVLRQGHRLDQGAHIGKDGGAAAVEQVFHGGEGGMQGKAAACLRRGGHDRQHAARFAHAGQVDRIVAARVA